MTISRRSLILGIPAAAAMAATATGAAATAARAATATAATATGGATGAASAEVPPFQSPIAIRSRTAVASPHLPRLHLDYPRRVDVTVRYVSRDDSCTTRGEEDVVQADVPAGAAALLLGTTRYDLLQYHFHTPSEHTLDGHRYPVEQHFVHSGPDGETLVLGLFLVPGGRKDVIPDPLPKECGPDLHAKVDLKTALPRDLSTFRYQGSLTTAPFTEPVSWLVLRQPLAVAATGIAGLRRLFPDGDARATQPLNGRVIRYRRQ
ncbi:carbonic anhydrase family protein [Virgisporangium aurantiacum]|uniref:carbonic anhydrase n=1 Tax=Virgisporangium aurantiacum TaxID=175570 RepID=A0A8J3ZD69_9ACTN|nr:carbonic anhydrase family protein [Virgisporangium aurantiacum]GIJ60727.1 carbonic anhydrase [Virgisporangium aurantiacum]